MANFNDCDANHDGAIDAKEIDTLLKTPAVKGDASAAVGALKLITRGSKTKLPPLTAEFFNRYNAAGGTDGDTPTTKPIDSPVRWDRYFTAGKKWIEIAGGTQWSASGFDIGRMKQGALGDCFFVASLGSVARHRFE